MSKKTAFKPEDFSPIHLYPEVPTKKGWYVSTWDRLESLHKGTKDIHYNTCSTDFWYWNGKEWCAGSSDIQDSMAVGQDRNWFGLNYEP